eukprot:425331-Rhodomonas_salina.1
MIVPLSWQALEPPGPVPGVSSSGPATLQWACRGRGGPRAGLFVVVVPGYYLVLLLFLKTCDRGPPPRPFALFVPREGLRTHRAKYVKVKFSSLGLRRSGAIA